MADAPLTPLSEKDAPKTFLERGAAVPFTTPALMWARVRQRANIKELLVPGLANTRGIYVFEWGGIPQRFTLTLHDRLLQRAIAPEPNPSPRVIAQIAEKIALTGAAGADVQAAGQRRAAHMAELLLGARHGLVLRLIGRMSGDGLITAGEIKNSAGQQRAKALLSDIAGRFKVTPQALQQRIETLAVLLADIGLPATGAKAPTRRLLRTLAQMSRVLREWAEAGKGDSVVEAQLIGEVAEATCLLCEPHTAAIDVNVQDIDALMREWPVGEKVIAAAAERLSWILDGWERLANMWLDVADKSTSDQSKTLALMSYLLPIVPVRELSADDAGKWGDFSKTLYGQARSWDTPATGLIDFEMMLRLEGHRARDAS
jgi:hypothetical protein